MNIIIGQTVHTLVHCVAVATTSTLGRTIQVLSAPAGNAEAVAELKKLLTLQAQAEQKFGIFGVVYSNPGAIGIQKIIDVNMQEHMLNSERDLGMAVTLYPVKAGTAYRWYAPGANGTPGTSTLAIATREEVRIISEAKRKGQTTLDENVEALKLIERYETVQRAELHTAIQLKAIKQYAAEGIPADIAIDLVKSAAQESMAKHVETKFERRERKAVSFSNNGSNSLADMMKAKAAAEEEAALAGTGETE